MDPQERFRRLEELFCELVALPFVERARRLQELGEQEGSLGRELGSLLSLDEDAGSFLEQPCMGAAAASSCLVGRRVGAYHVVRELGRGGMGIVYEAERADGAYTRRVALKALALEMDRDDHLRRFHAERQILASLDHPGVARLLDGGTTEDGRPYLVMEYIDGIPIDRYCEQRSLGVAERVDLVRAVCASVSYAHRRLVVHRDLKPSNILVTSDGAPRLLDFGIAKLLPTEAAASDATTTTRERPMTLPYASPEQVSGGPITTATDVYALGVLLYQLLCRRLPYRLESDDRAALEQAILGQTPERPSAVAGRQQPSLGRMLAGDLDNILLKSLSKDPQDRYSSVEQFAEDLERYRQGRPVSARPALTGYRLRKFVGRHRLAVAAGGLLTALVLGLGIATAVQAVRLSRQRDEIRRERDKAMEVTRLLEKIFEDADPSQSRGATITAREILDAGAERTMTALAGEPEIQAALAHTLGRVYGSLGLYDRAEPLLQRALALREARLGPDHPALADTLDVLGDISMYRADAARAEPFYRRSVAIRRPSAGADPLAAATSLSGLAMALIRQARHAEAGRLLDEALPLSRARPGTDREERILSILAALRREQGDLPAAEALSRQALAVHQRRQGGAHPDLSILLNNLALVLEKKGDLPGAERALRESLAVGRRVWGDEHTEIARRLTNLAAMLSSQQRYAEAEPLCRKGLALYRRLVGAENASVVAALNILALIREGRGDLEGARRHLSASAAIAERVLGGGHPQVALALFNLSRVRQRQGALAEAEALAERALAIRRKALPPDHPDIGWSLVMVGARRLQRGRGSEAEAPLREGLQRLRRRLPQAHWQTASAESLLGACLAALKRDGEAEPLLVGGYDRLSRARGPAFEGTRDALQRLVRFLESRGRRAEAAEYRARPSS